mgnify:CR=1 FL=1
MAGYGTVERNGRDDKAGRYMKKRLLLLGAGGHCRSIIDALKNDEYAEIGIVNKEGYSYMSVDGVPIVGEDEDLESLFAQGWEYAFVAVGSVGDTNIRRQLFNSAKRIGFKLPVIIDKTACVSKNVFVGEGVFVGKNAVINSNARVGIGAIINSGAIIEHDCKIGEFAHISPGAVLCGGVSIGRDTHIGANASVREGILVGDNCIVGIGSVVVTDLSKGVLAYGNPCREIVKA